MSVVGLIIDKWSAISHKAPMSDTPAGRTIANIEGWVPSPWTGELNRRRLTAYMVLAAYEQNSARHFLSTSDQADRDDRREYGDAGLVIDQTLAALLGETQEVVVPGADDYDPELDVTDEDPAAAAEATAANDAARVLADRQEFLRTWADDCHLPLRMADTERNAVGLGDGVWLIGWDDRKGRPVPTCMDPGFYFPILPDTLDAYDFPETVHFAWELPGEDFPDNKARVRRLTYRLARLQPVFDEAALASASTEEDFAAAQSLPEGARWVGTPDGPELVRDYPWNEEPSAWTCLFSDATWVLDDLNDAHRVDAFTLSNASVAADSVDLGIDFVPVVHEPNLPPGGDHFGQSSLARVLQLLDDLQNADTDAQAASATTGSPIVGVSGSNAGGSDPLTGQRATSMDVKPGAVWRLGDGGSIDVVDTSANLAATREYVEHLLERLSVNSRLPAAVLGRLKPSEVPSGFAMQLSFGPLSSMVRQMRLVRAVKYPLLLKMAQRLYQANGILPDGPTPRAEVKFGPFLPADMAGTLTMVQGAYKAKLISLETAVVMLIEAGFPVDDVAQEIVAIQGRDFEAAGQLADATGDVEEARKYLALDPAATITVPVVTQPAQA